MLSWTAMMVGQWKALSQMLGLPTTSTTSFDQILVHYKAAADREFFLTVLIDNR